mgnify:CR=1 FL=1
MGGEGLKFAPRLTGCRRLRQEVYRRAWQNETDRLYLAPRMNIPPPDLPPPGNLPPPGGLPPPNLPSPNLPPPADNGSERVISQFERAPVETNVAAKVAKQIEEAIAERPLMDAAALKEDAKTYPWRRGRDHLLRTGSLIVLAFAIGAKLPLAGILLTGNQRPSPSVMRVVEALPFPVLLTREESYTVASRVHDLTVKTRPADTEKIALIRDLIAKHVDVNRILQPI